MSEAAVIAADTLAPLRRFVAALDRLAGTARDEAHLLAAGEQALARLIARDDWLPDSHAAPDPVRYRQYLLHADPGGRFSVVSFVWAPGQATPIHDHGVWGLVGVLRGAERSESFAVDARGVRKTGERIVSPGGIEAVSPRIGDVHRVSNAHDDRVSISIHAYGADIGKVERHVYEACGEAKRFVSGYAPVPALI